MKVTVTVTRVSNGFIFEDKNKRLVFTDASSATEKLIEDIGRSLQNMEIGKASNITIGLESVQHESKGN